MKHDAETFLNVLNPEDTSTGGGSASAIAGAMAGALIGMVCLLSASASNDPQGESFGGTAIRAQELSHQLLAGSSEDTQAYRAVRRAYKLPQGSEEERKIRNQAVQSAWFEAARVPLENAARCVQVVKLGSDLSGRINPRVRSDLTCATLLARAGVLGCLENVATNLPSINDLSIASQLAQQADSLRAQLASLDQATDNRQPNQPFPA